MKNLKHRYLTWRTRRAIHRMIAEAFAAVGPSAEEICKEQTSNRGTFTDQGYDHCPRQPA